MISTSNVYFYLLFFWVCYIHDVIGKPDAEHCCCDEKKSVNVFGLPSDQAELKKDYNYSDSAEDVFRKIANDSDIVHTAETLDKGYYTSLCWSEIITAAEKKNGTITVTKEYAITFETKSDIPDKYIKVDTIKVAPEYKQYQIYDQATKKSQIVNFTTISKSDDTIIRQSRKMFCGSGPIYTKEYTRWAQTDRKRIEIKVSPKKQSLVANNVDHFNNNNNLSYENNTTNGYTNPTDTIQETSKTGYPNESDNLNKASTNNLVYTSKEFSTRFTTPKFITKTTPNVNEVTPKLSTNVTTHSTFTTAVTTPNISNTTSNNRNFETTFIKVPEIIYATNPLEASFRPDYSLSSKPIKGKVPNSTIRNPDLADDHDNQNDKDNPVVTTYFLKQHLRPVRPFINTFPLTKTFFPINFTTSNQKDITVTTRTVTTILTNSDSKIRGLDTTHRKNNENILSTTISLKNVNVAQTPLDAETTTPHAITTIATSTYDYDDDFSDELGDIRKDVTKSTDCSTTDVTENLINRKFFSTTTMPDVKIENIQVTNNIPTNAIPNGISGFGGSVNRIAYGDYQGSNDNIPNRYDVRINKNRPDTVRNSTEILFPMTNLPIRGFKQRQNTICNLPKQKITIKVRISIDDNIVSNEPNNYYSYSFPILGIEKHAEIPISSIKEVPTVPNEIINFEWNKFINDLGNHFFVINKEYVLNFSQLVNQVINSTAPESELDHQILPEETVKRLQGIKDYLENCKILQVNDVTPKFRFSGDLGHQDSRIRLNRPDYGFYNYLIPPQYPSSNNHPIQTNNGFGSYIQNYPQATTNQLLTLAQIGNNPELLNRLQLYYYLPQSLNNRNWQKKLPNLLPSSSSYNSNYRFHRNSLPNFSDESVQTCPGCKRVSEFTTSLDKVLNHLQSFLQSKK